MSDRDTTNGLEGLWGQGRIRAFISHKAEDKELAHGIKQGLDEFGIASFVSHEDIEPMKEWVPEIERALFSMDLLIALLTEEFSESNWTDQEIGVAIGRRKVIIPVRIGERSLRVHRQIPSSSRVWRERSPDQQGDFRILVRI